MPTSRKRKKKVNKKKKRVNNNGVPAAVDRKLRNKIEEAGYNYSSKIKHEHTVSELILDFLEHEKKFCHTQHEMRNMVSIGIACWNIALLDEEKQEEQIQILLTKLQSDTKAEETVRDLVARKKEYFDKYKYLVARHELIFTREGVPHLSVASAKLD